ncbi:MAG: DUF1707 domain-containing protein [Pseudonocardiaceae bacterium]|nr:DUF1707 domain-containing protein [Pseudonocardiaceae bacterium]
MRLSDAERQDALDALGEHFKSGRLDVDEYGERTAHVAAARMRSDLKPLFADLPDPKPGVLRPRKGQVYAAQPVAPRPGWRLPQPIAAAAVPIAAVLAVLLVLTVLRGAWFIVFLLPALVAMMVGGWGGPPHRRRHWHRRHWR